MIGGSVCVFNRSGAPLRFFFAPWSRRAAAACTKKRKPAIRNKRRVLESSVIQLNCRRL
jgi:hypothetical protein